MRMAIVWVDPGLDPHHVVVWPADNTRGVALVVGPQAGTEVIAWLDRVGLQAVLLVGRPSTRRTTRYVASIISGARPDLLVAVRHVPVGALAALVCGVTVDTLDAWPSALLQCFDHMVGRIWCGAWLRSVGALTAPNPDFGSYVRSLIPGGPRFLALFGPAPRVELAGKPISGAPISGDLMVAVAPDAEVPDALTASFPGLQLMRLPVPAPIRGAYGSSGIEFVLNDRLPPPTMTRTWASCRVCGQPLHEESCPFCHIKFRSDHR